MTVWNKLGLVVLTACGGSYELGSPSPAPSPWPMAAQARGAAGNVAAGSPEAAPPALDALEADDGSAAPKVWAVEPLAEPFEKIQAVCEGEGSGQLTLGPGQRFEVKAGCAAEITVSGETVSLVFPDGGEPGPVRCAPTGQCERVDR